MPASRDTADREIVTTRTVNAPRDLVWQVWTQPDHIAHWWGPNGFRTTTHEMTLKVGGIWRFMMHGPDGKDYPNLVVYREIVKPERLVYDHSEDKPNPDISFLVTVTFEDVGHKTKVTLHSLFPTAAAREAVRKFGADEGAIQTLARMEEHLAKLQG